MTKLKLDEIQADLEAGNVDTTYDKQSQLTSVLVGDGLDFTGYIINPNGKVVASHEFGFSVPTTVPTAEHYLKAYIENPRDNVYETLHRHRKERILQKAS